MYKQFETEEEYNKALEEVRKAERAKFEGYASPDSIAEYEKRIKTLTEKSLKIEHENAQYKLNALKARIAGECGIRPELAERLNGSTEEELRADAKTFSGYMPTAPLKSTETPKESGYEADLKAFTNSLFNGAVNQ